MVLLENATPPWADGNDDDGTLTEGQALDASLYDGYRSSVDSLIHSTTNPTETPAGIIDENVEARGNLNSINERFAGVIDVNGDFLRAQYHLNGFQASAIGGGLLNYLMNEQMLLWHLGDALAPSGWTLAGAGATIARAGTGLGDTTKLIGDFCAKITYAGTQWTLEQTVISSGTIAGRLPSIVGNVNAYDSNAASIAQGSGRAFGAAVAVNAVTAAAVQVYVDYGSGQAASAYHPGDGNWYILGVPFGVPNTGTELTLGIVGAANAYVGGAYLGPFPNTLLDTDGGVDFAMFPLAFAPCRMIRKTETFNISGNVTTGTRKFGFLPRRLGIVTDVQLDAGTAPTGQALIVDVNTYDGAALTSMFSTRPQIADGANAGGAQPDTTYARRCLYPYFGATRAAGGLVTVDVDQIGSGAPGADLTITIGYLEYARPFEGFYNYNTLGA